MATEEIRKDLRAAVAARQELGPDYELEVIEGFLSKLDAHTAQHLSTPPVKAEKPSRESDPGGLALAIVSVTAGIPITAIAASQEGAGVIFICWGGLVGINLARAIGRFVGRQH